MAAAARAQTPRAWSSRTAWVLELPGSFVVVLATHTVLQQLAALGALEPMRSHPASAVIALAMLAMWLLLARVLARSTALVLEPGVVWAALAAPAVLVGYALVGVALLGRSWVEWFLGGDNVRHVVMVSDLVHGGALTYVEPYPKGWHAFVATLWSATHSGMPDADISRFVEFVAAATWGLTALLVLTLGSAAAAIVQRLGVRGHPAWLGVGLAGLAGLLPRITSDLLALGFQTSILSTLVLAVLVRESFTDRSRITGIVVVAACCVSMAHAWQLFLPVPVSIMAVVGVHAWLTRGRFLRLAVSSAAVTVLLACWTPVVRLLQTRDASVVGLPGVAPDIPWALIAVGCVAFFLVALWIRELRVVSTAGVVVLGPALIGGALVVVLGLHLNDYYPTKMLWTTGMIALPFIGASAARLASTDVAPRLTRPVVVAVALVVGALGAGSPSGALMGGWSTVSADHVLRALEIPAVDAAEGVWMQSVTETTVVRTLLDVYRPDRAPGLMRDGVTLEQECDWLRATSDPVVITTHDPQETERRYACASVSVLRVRR